MTQTAPEPVVSARNHTPSGIEIVKEEKPRRLYRVRESHPPNLDTGPWYEVPSVTTILEALSIPLKWFGMEVGVRAVQELYRRYENEEMVLKSDPERVIQVLTEEKLTVNHDFGKAATKKGTNVHRALENFALTGVVPDPMFYPEDEKGFIQALVAFINDAHPHTLHSELMVASMEDGWAGTLDWVVNLDFAGQVVTKTYQKKAEVRSSVSGSWIIDAKTSSEKPGKPKSVYPSYMIQGRAYERGFSECGYGEVDHFGVLRLTNDGRYELVESTATYDDFLAVKNVYEILQRIKGK